MNTSTSSYFEGAKATFGIHHTIHSPAFLALYEPQSILSYRHFICQGWEHITREYNGSLASCPFKLRKSPTFGKLPKNGKTLISHPQPIIVERKSSRSPAVAQ
ncbi:hypothetical protein AB1N83_014122 [Pleurotus pulmonarius]